MSTVADRLTQAMKARETNPTALSNSMPKATRISQTTIHRMANGYIQEPKADKLNALAELLTVNPIWLQTGRGQMSDVSSLQRIAPKGFTVASQFGAPLLNQVIPVVGHAKLGDNAQFYELEYPIGHGDGGVRWASRDSEAYALRCDGDSMRPRIKNGEYVVVEPNRAPVPGDEVVVRSDDGRVMVKEWLYTRDGVVSLGSVNESHPIVRIPQFEVQKMHYVAGIAKSELFNPN